MHRDIKGGNILVTLDGAVKLGMRILSPKVFLRSLQRVFSNETSIFVPYFVIVIQLISV